MAKLWMHFAELDSTNTFFFENVINLTFSPLIHTNRDQGPAYASAYSARAVGKNSADRSRDPTLSKVHEMSLLDRLLRRKKLFRLTSLQRNDFVLARNLIRGNGNEMENEKKCLRIRKLKTQCTVLMWKLLKVVIGLKHAI